MIAVVTLLTLLMIVGAIVAVETARLLFAVISVGAVGFLAAIAFLFLGAPDIAIVQIGVEVISLVILLRAVRPETASATGRRARVAALAALALVAAVGLFAFQVLADFPPFGRSVMERLADAPSTRYLLDGLAGTGAPNIVTAVLLDFRAYDTLGEATVLFCAVLGARAILRRQGRAPAATTEGGDLAEMTADPAGEDMGSIVLTVARWLSGLILTYGVYVILHGHLTPGGAFEGGVIIACGFILLTLASGQAQGLGQLSRRAAAAFNSAGVLLFLALAWAGMGWADGMFFENFIATPEAARFTLFSGGIIPLSNIGLGLMVTSSLFLVFAALAAFRIVAAGSEPQGEDR